MSPLTAGPDPVGRPNRADVPSVRIRFDGACELTPIGRVAAYGFTASGPGDGYEECGLAVRPDSERATNNVAEYTGAVRALEWLVAEQYDGLVEVEGDSELVVRQMNGEYRVRADHLRAYHDRLVQLRSRFREVTFRWIPRSENQRADELSKQAIREAVRQPSGSGTNGASHRRIRTG